MDVADGELARHPNSAQQSKPALLHYLHFSEVDNIQMLQELVRSDGGASPAAVAGPMIPPDLISLLHYSPTTLYDLLAHAHFLQDHNVTLRCQHQRLDSSDFGSLQVDTEQCPASRKHTDLSFVWSAA
jgi:hypothetical protein